MPAAANELPDRLIVLYNLHSSQHRSSLQGDTTAETYIPPYKYRADIHDQFPITITEIPTSRDPAETERRLHDTLAVDNYDHTRVVTVGGDGTVGIAALALTHAEVQRNHPRTDLAVLPGGYANDIYQATRSVYPGYDPVKTIGGAYVHPIYPVRANIQAPDNEQTIHRAAAYLSLGVSALGAAFLNSPELRQRSPSPGRDLRVLGHLIRHGKRFKATITEQAEQPDIPAVQVANPQQQHLWDAIHPAINRMAKDISFRHVDLTSDALHTYVVHAKRIPLLAAIAGAYLGIMSHAEYPPTTQLTYQLTGKHGLRLQHDGEAEVVPAGSQVTISRETIPYHIVVG